MAALTATRFSRTKPRTSSSSRAQQIAASTPPEVNASAVVPASVRCGEVAESVPGAGPEVRPRLRRRAGVSGLDPAHDRLFEHILKLPGCDRNGAIALLTAGADRRVGVPRQDLVHVVLVPARIDCHLEAERGGHRRGRLSLAHQRAADRVGRSRRRGVRAPGPRPRTGPPRAGRGRRSRRFRTTPARGGSAEWMASPEHMGPGRASRRARAGGSTRRRSDRAPWRAVSRRWPWRSRACALRPSSRQPPGRRSRTRAWTVAVRRDEPFPPVRAP